MKMTLLRKSLCLSAAAFLLIGLAGCQEADFRPGTYTVETQGYSGTISVKIKLDASRISSVSAGADSEEEEEYASEALDAVAQAIEEQQRVDVDNVAGATVTSEAVKTAVERCLISADYSGNLSKYGVRTGDQIAGLD